MARHTTGDTRHEFDPTDTNGLCAGRIVAARAARGCGKRRDMLVSQSPSTLIESTRRKNASSYRC
jgi:hypothetical protein